jgi:hypothetical protein
MVVTAHNGVKTYKGIEHEIALHSLILAVRLWCAALNEAETVIWTAWHRSRLSAKMHSKLSADAINALKCFQRYFAKASLVRTVRDKFASVYSALPAITRLSPGKEAEIFSTILRRQFETRRCSMKLGRLIRV